MEGGNVLQQFAVILILEQHSDFSLTQQVISDRNAAWDRPGRHDRRHPNL